MKKVCLQMKLGFITVQQEYFIVAVFFIKFLI